MYKCRRAGGADHEEGRERGLSEWIIRTVARVLGQRMAGIVFRAIAGQPR